MPASTGGEVPAYRGEGFTQLELDFCWLPPVFRWGREPSHEEFDFVLRGPLFPELTLDDMVLVLQETEAGFCLDELGARGGCAT